MPERSIIVIGCSVGGVEALQKLVAGLPHDLPPAIFVVLHIGPQTRSVLPEILSRAGRLPARHPRQGETIRRSHIYVAPPDQHLIIENNRIVLSRGPKENRHRPAVDPLFRSAARAYGRQVIGIVMTGSLDDGTMGLLTIKKAGGTAIVQDPEDAVCSDMPRSAMQHVKVDYVLPVTEIPAVLAELVPQPVSSGNGLGRDDDVLKEIKIAQADMAAIEDDNRPGTPSQFGCPDCGGVLWEIDDQEMLRFRCRVGHAFTAQSLGAQQSEAVEGALWAAMRAMEESASLAHRMANKAEKARNHKAAQRFQDRAKDKMEKAELLRNLIRERNEVAAD
jgi:two-component system, chemotaxis family, protein-glutamate methylesterase/glutaminase